MYGLPQAGRLAQTRLIDHLAHHGYHQTKTTCLFRHITNGTAFSLVVDDFGVKYTTKEAALHLIATLELLYVIKVDWSGAHYIGFTIAFDRERRTVSLTMPGYIEKVLRKFPGQNRRGAASPSIYTPPSYNKTTSQLPTPVDDSPNLSAQDTKRIEEIVGSILYYARALDLTMLHAVNALSSMQAHPTEHTMLAAERLLDYCARYPNNELVFTACDMILYIQVDASYLSRPHARSVAGGILYLGDRDAPERVNGAVHAFSLVIQSVVASVAEAEYAALFSGGQEGEGRRDELDSLGYPQPATLMLGDNKCAVGISSDTIKPKRTKSIDMRFHWIRDRIRQGHFIVRWRPGVNNLADFFTKSLPVHQHQAMMQLLVRVPPTTVHSAALTRRARRCAFWAIVTNAQRKRGCVDM
jgi:hypothetical protein